MWRTPAHADNATPTRVILVESGRALDADSVDDERAIETRTKQGVATQNTTQQ